MKLKGLAVLLFVAAAVLCVSKPAPAVVEKSAEASVSLMSDYVWRGFNLGDDGVVQPSVGLNYGGFGMNVWSNYDMDTRQANETDLTLDYAFSAGGLGLDAGYIYYGLDGIEDTQEVYLSAGYDVLLSPSLAVYYDFDEGDGAYLEASVGHSFGFGRDMSLDLGAVASYNLESKYSIGDYSGFHHADLSVSFTLPLGGGFSLEPMLAYSFALSGDSESSIEAVSADGESDRFYGGITASLGF